MRAYKLTDENGCTHGNTQWGPGVTHEAKPGNKNLCTEYYIHGYIDTLIAVYMNPVHGTFANPLLWEVETDGDHLDDNGLKFGAKIVTTMRTIPIPVITPNQRVAAAIYIARAVLEMYHHHLPTWETWGDNWLLNVDRTASAAYAAANAARATYAARAAYAAANAARATYAATYAAYAAAYAADAATYAADAAAYAADAATYAADAVHFPSLLILCLYAAMEVE